MSSVGAICTKTGSITTTTACSTRWRGPREKRRSAPRWRLRGWLFRPAPRPAGCQRLQRAGAHQRTHTITSPRCVPGRRVRQQPPAPRHRQKAHGPTITDTPCYGPTSVGNTVSQETGWKHDPTTRQASALACPVWNNSIPVVHDRPWFRRRAGSPFAAPLQAARLRQGAAGGRAQSGPDPGRAVPPCGPEPPAPPCRWHRRFSTTARQASLSPRRRLEPPPWPCRDENGRSGSSFGRSRFTLS